MNTPIGDYGLISDCHSAALVSRQGSIDWLCFPRFDRPSTFARILDADAGHFSIHPVEEAQVSRRYLDDTMVLETTFETRAGSLVLTDALAVGRNERGHELGANSPHILLRRAECTNGKVDIEVEYSPRPEYGLIHPLMNVGEGGIRARGGADVLLLSTVISLEIARSHARGRVTLSAGEKSAFALHHRNTWEAEPDPWTPEEIEISIDETVTAWRAWSEMHQGYEGPWQELVMMSGRVLQALTYQPTGAIVAAPTTLASGRGRRGTQLGLSLRVGTGCKPHAGGSVGRGLP